MSVGYGVGFGYGFGLGAVGLRRSDREWSPSDLANLQTWYDPSDLITLFQDSAMTAPVASDGDPDGAILDLGPLGLDAIQATTTKRPTYRTSDDESWLELDLIDDALSIEIPSGGLDGTMIISTADGTAAYGVSIPEGTFEILRKYYPDDRFYGAIFIDGTATAKQISDSIDYLKAKGGGDSYGGRTSVSSAWRDWGHITSFPLINTSSVASLDVAWRNCTSLTSFPLIDTSSVISMRTAWRGCTSLATFPLLDTSSVTDMYRTWYGCSSLTSFPLIDTSSVTNMGDTWNGCNSLTSFPLIDASSVTNMDRAWFRCTSLTSFPLIDASSVTDMIGTWAGCTSLASFPLIDTSSVTNMGSSWRDCGSLASFPLLDTSSVTSMGATWLGCTSLTTFPLIDTSSVTNMGVAWRGCTSLTSFPLIDTSSVTNMGGAWMDCTSLTSFPAGVFDSCPCTSFSSAFTNTALSEASIDNILVSINTANTSSGTFGQSGGSAPSITGEAAIDALRSRGWTVTVTGGY